MTAPLQPTGSVTLAVGRPANRTGSNGGAARLDEQVEYSYGLLPLYLPNPDATDIPHAAEYARYAAKYYVDLSTTELLEDLTERHGLMWLTIAKVAQVSVPGLRKWRMGGNPNAQRKAALARLLAACNALETVGIVDVAAWLNAPIWIDRPRLRVELLSLTEGGESLLALAQERISAAQALDALDNHWRETYVQAVSDVTYDADGIGTVHLAN